MYADNGRSSYISELFLRRHLPLLSLTGSISFSRFPFHTFELFTDILPQVLYLASMCHFCLQQMSFIGQVIIWTYYYFRVYTKWEDRGCMEEDCGGSFQSRTGESVVGLKCVSSSEK